MLRSFEMRFRVLDPIEDDALGTGDGVSRGTDSAGAVPDASGAAFAARSALRRPRKLCIALSPLWRWREGPTQPPESVEVTCASTAMAEFQKESLTLEETNRVRISLGLKPLEDDAAPKAESSQARQDEESARNFAAHRDAARQREAEDATRERIAKAQNRRALARKLRGPTLGEGEDEGARAWVKAAARRARANAADRLAREKEEEEEQAAREYGAADLQGLRVAHDLDEIEGQERVLTLRDADVLDEGEDELVDASLDRAERDRQNRERKKGPKAYTGLDEDEEHAGRILAQYDDDNNDTPAAGSSGFRLGDASSADAMARRAEARHAAQAAADARRAQMTSLDYLKNAPVSDYEAPEVGFKKAKKKKRHTTRVKVEPEDDVPPPAPAPAPAPAAPRERSHAENLVDDDELAASLARTRRHKAKQSMQALTPEAIAKNLAAQKAAEDAEAPRAPAPDEMTFDETTEFVRQIGQRPTDAPRAPREAVHDAAPVDGAALLARDEPMPAAEDGGAPAHEREDADAPVHDTPGVPTEAEWAELAADAPADAAAEDVPADASADDGALAGGGVAGALRLLRSQGILEESTPEQREREKTQLRYDAWMHAQKKADQQRAHERLAARGTPKDQATRERENRLREKREAEDAVERFKDYTPDVKLEYHDEFGRTLTQKEAWKRLSHVFHGNAPGHKAQEKRLRRIAEEQRRERMLAGDTSSLSQAFQERSARTGQAHMVLSVGNRDHAPQEIDLLGREREAQLSKAPPPGRGAERTKRAPPTGPPRGPPPGLAAGPPPGPAPAGPPPGPAPAGPAVGAPASASAPAGAEAAPAAAPAAAPDAAPKPAMKPAFAPAMSKAGFAPVSAPSAAPSAAPAGEAPVPREKVRIALGKRKAP